ncbi:MAG: hypothetical protein AAGA47_03700 [Pseudomonadota bacterium]
MVPTVICILGFAGYGAWRAKKGGGKTIDVLHYAASHGIFGLIVGVLIAIVLSRMI